MIKIDFHASTHGHFLEYVTNVYIMQTTPSQVSIFKPPTYSAHAACSQYLNDRHIICGHFSNPRYNSKIDDDDIVIRINIDCDNDDMFFIALTNLIYKAGDIGVEKQMLSIPDHVKNNPVALRNNWYSKIQERQLYIHKYNNFSTVSNNIFNFSFESFFCFTNFAKDLHRLAQFLNQTFFPDQTLYELWAKFIELNQGRQSHIKCNQILTDIFSNNCAEIDCTVIEQGWINYNLSKMCGLYQGSVFEDLDYPTNTQKISAEIARHFSALR
jgi:hypothetical protein